MPKSIARFERLMYLSLAIAIGGDLAGPRLELMPGLWTGGAMRWVPGVVDVTVAAALTWFAVRRRRNWARWLLVGRFALQLLQVLWVLPHVPQITDLSPRLTGVIVSLLALSVQAAALFFAVFGESASWFAAEAPGAPQSAAGSRVAFVFLLLLSAAAAVALWFLPVFIVVGGMACDIGCSLLTPLALALLPLALGAGALAGWAVRGRSSLSGLFLLSLAPPVVDIAILALGAAWPELLPA